MTQEITHEMIDFPKAIYTREELPSDICEYLLTFRQGLIDDFLAGYQTLQEANEHHGVYAVDRRDMGASLDTTVPWLNFVEDDDNLQSKLEQWKMTLFRFKADNHEEGVVGEFLVDKDSELAKKFPTATKLSHEVADYCGVSMYSLYAPRTVMLRHTGPENREGKYIRIHIPLIIPEGDIFLEVNGEEARWTDIFGFNNQLAHSSHNYSYEHRLIYMIDLEREKIGLPKSPPYNHDWVTYARPYVKKTVDVEWDDDGKPIWNGKRIGV